MAELSSQGTFGLSHFRSSRAAVDQLEPVYLNLFTVQLQLPDGVGSTPENTNLLLENVQKISGLVSHKFPTTLITQYYKWAVRRYAGAKPENTFMDLTLDFEVNIDITQSAYVLKTLRKWCDLVYDPLTGRTGVKADYTAPWMLITMYDRAARPFWQWRCLNVFPMTVLPAPELDYQSDTNYKITGFGIGVDNWDETIV